MPCCLHPALFTPVVCHSLARQGYTPHQGCYAPHCPRFVVSIWSKMHTLRQNIDDVDIYVRSMYGRRSYIYCRNLTSDESLEFGIQDVWCLQSSHACNANNDARPRRTLARQARAQSRMFGIDTHQNVCGKGGESFTRQGGALVLSRGTIGDATIDQVKAILFCLESWIR